VRDKRLFIFPAALLTGALACSSCGGGGPKAASGGTTTTSSAGGTTTTVAPATVAPSSTTRPRPTTSRPTTSTTTSTGPASTSTTGKPAAQGAGGSVPAGFDPVSFTAISDSEFWLLGDAPCAEPDCTSILRTTDGGASFTGVPAPQAPLAVAGSTSPSPGVNTLRFADAKDGYAFATGPGGQFWDTHDGGQTWSEPAALSGKDLLGFGSGDGYALVLAGTCANGSCSQVVLERSPVGGDNWAALPVPVPSGVDELATMAVHGPNVWLSMSASSSQSNQLLVVSTNAGTSFTSYQSPCSPDLGGTLEASSAEVVWAVCPTGMMAQAFRTDDGGAHWATLPTGELPNSAQIAPASDSSALLVTSEGGPLELTTDDGSTWTDVSGTVTSDSWAWSWLGFTDAQTGTALQETGNLPSGWPWPHGPFPERLMRTTDGGKTWSGPLNL
jgi:photosystem II stability/assembly factor-like uncharacterized protein